MNKVYGPIIKQDWVTMAEVLGSINWMKKHNLNNKYQELIELEEELYQTYKKRYVA